MKSRPRSLERRSLSVALSWLALCTGCGEGGDGGVTSPEPAPPGVAVVAVRAMTLRPELELVGSLTAAPERVARVAVRVSGAALEVAVLEGEKVREGQVLVRLDPSLFEADVAQAAALLEQREATLEALANGPRAEELEVARKELARAEALARAPALVLEALEGVADEAQLSPVRLHEARTARDAADAEVAVARSALRLLEAGTRPEQLREAEAAVAAARAALDAARTRLAFADVVSPLAGTVTQVQARAGEWLSPGTPVVEVVDLSTLLLRVRVPAASVPSLDPAVPGRVTIEGSSAPLEGRLERLGARAEEASGGVWALVAVENTGRLRPGMSARVALPLTALEECTVVPLAAVAERAGTPVVTRIEDGVAHEVAVRTGARSGGWVEILEGLSVGDRVATEGGYGLPDGRAVDVVEEATE